jgi:hypothetical protein
LVPLPAGRGVPVVSSITPPEVPLVPDVPLVPVAPVVPAPPPGWPVPLAFELPLAAAEPVAVAVPLEELPAALSPEPPLVELQAARLQASMAPKSTL